MSFESSPEQNQAPEIQRQAERLLYEVLEEFKISDDTEYRLAQLDSSAPEMNILEFQPTQRLATSTVENNFGPVALDWAQAFARHVQERLAENDIEALVIAAHDLNRAPYIKISFITGAESSDAEEVDDPDSAS